MHLFLCLAVVFADFWNAIPKNPGGSSEICTHTPGQCGFSPASNSPLPTFFNQSCLWPCWVNWNHVCCWWATFAFMANQLRIVDLLRWNNKVAISTFVANLAFLGMQFWLLTFPFFLCTLFDLAIWGAQSKTLKCKRIFSWAQNISCLSTNFLRLLVLTVRDEKWKKPQQQPCFKMNALCKYPQLQHGTRQNGSGNKFQVLWAAVSLAL